MRIPSTAFLRANAPWLTAGLLLAFSSSYGQTYFISLFAGEIMAEFSLTHGQWSSIYGAGTLMSAALMIFVGGVTDRFRVRLLGALIMLGLAAACVSMSVVQAAWALVPVIFGLRFFGQGMSSHLSSVAMARWFVANRGKALAVATIGFALGESVLPITFVSLMGSVDWRLLWLVAAGLALLAIPALALLLQRERTPQSMGEHEQSPGMGGRHWTRKEAIQHPLFWCAVPLIIGPAAFLTATFFHQVHLSAEKGWEHIQFVSLFPVYTVATITGMIGSGLLIDRFGTGRLMQIYQLPMAAAFVMMGWSSGLVWGGMSMVFLGLGHGIAVTVPTAFWADYFGTRHLGSIRALATAIMVFGTALGPVITGWAIDAGVSFDQQMPVIALYFIATSALIGVGLRAAGPLVRYARG